MSTTHIAGIALGFRTQDLFIQRCALCGEKLIEMRPSCTAVPNGQDPTLHQWQVGHLIRVEGENPVHSEDLGDFMEVKTLPDDFCLVLVERD